MSEIEPIDAYVTLAEFTDWANVDLVDDAEEAKAALVVVAAAREIDGHCSRDFRVAAADPTVRTYRTGLDGRFLDVDDFHTGTTPSATVDGATVDDLEVITSGPPGSPAWRLKGRFGRHRTVSVTARWGWPAVPEPVRLANLMIALKLWERRNSPYGTQGNVEIGFVRVTGIDRDVDTLLSNFVRWDLKIAFGGDG